MEFNMAIDISIDLETLSTRPNAAVIAIGAAMIDRDSGEVIKTFYRSVAPILNNNKVAHVDYNTITWWMGQSEEARGVFREIKTSPYAAIRDFTNWLPMFPDYHVWGNGSSFDVTILESLLYSLEMNVPWNFYHVRDLRTLADAAISVGVSNHKDALKRQGVHHNALDDALYQAKAVHHYFSEMAKLKGGV